MTRTSLIVAAALAAAGVAVGAASASDAQIRATLLHGIQAINHEKVGPLSTDLIVVRATLQAEQPSTQTGRTAKTLAVQGFHYVALAAGEQAAAAEDLKDAGVGGPNYDPTKLDDAQAQLGQAAKNMTAGTKLLRQAAHLLHITVKVK